MKYNTLYLYFTQVQTNLSISVKKVPEVRKNTTQQDIINNQFKIKY